MTSAMTVSQDDRLVKANPMVVLLRRPEIGAAVAALAILLFFSITTEAFLTPAGVSTWIYSSSLFGIMAVAVALLMIGGEFDLSAGVMTGSTALFVGVVTTQWGISIWFAVPAALVIALAIGAWNAFLVVRTGLPSFIVTLATFFILQGINLALTKMITGTVQVQGMRQVPGYDTVKLIFGSSFPLFGMTIKIAVVWWIVITTLATAILMRTKFGNWTFAVGGDPDSARENGVPVPKVKLGLFMTTAGAGWLVGMLQLFDVSTAQATTGIGEEFIYIICAVVGGCLLMGGFGSAIGAAIGALIYGMTLQGIVFAQWDNNWLKAFLGTMLLMAVMANLYINKRARAAV
ncbi:ABC transporter permease [Sphaerimonospora sp. CA-214678]|uniref:ABC transporter permease n=1 Tax=Sphaerimonospora sp. CA-214678 TaxID=3240029 RepID=UPI003D946822